MGHPESSQELHGWHEGLSLHVQQCFFFWISFRLEAFVLLKALPVAATDDTASWLLYQIFGLFLVCICFCLASSAQSLESTQSLETNCGEGLLASGFAYVWVQLGKIVALQECKDNSPSVLHMGSSHPLDHRST